MQYLLQRKVINFIFFTGLIAFVISCGMIYLQLQRLITQNSQVTHTYAVISELDGALLSLVTAEKDIQLYFETNDKPYLLSYQTALNNLQMHINKTKQLTRHNEFQQQRLLMLSALIQKFFDQSKSLLQSFNAQGKAYALETYTSAANQAVDEKIKILIYDLSKTEAMLLKGRNNQAMQSAIKNTMLIIAVSILTTILLIISFLLLSYQLNLRLRAERLKQIAENQLQGIIEGTSDMIAALDLNMNFIAFNKAYKLRFKQRWGKNIALGNNLRNLLNGNTPEELEILQTWERALSGEEFTLIKRTNDDTFYEKTFNTIRNNDKERIGASHIIHNITQRKQEEIHLKHTNERLEVGLQELETRYHEIALLNEMSESLQSCLTMEEAYSPIKTYCQQIFPKSKGIVYLMHPSRTYLELAVAFGDPNVTEYTFAPEACWALRRNQIHRVDNAEQSIICSHVKAMHPDEMLSYVCVPLMAHNETLGLFYLEMPREIIDSTPLANSHRQLLLVTMAEQISLALANIKLRETLRFLSVRDPLTGLYNRRYLEETLAREFHRAERNKNSVAIIMADIDHFKRFNDTYGHDAGDCVLRRVGKVFQDMTRGSDVICRFGGEEFLIFLYDTDLAAAKVYAERIQKATGELDIQYGGKTLGAITISLGIAVFPSDGTKPQSLIEAADEALYKAKKAGRNCIKLATDPIVTNHSL